MKSKILGLLAVGLLAGPMAAWSASVNYADRGWYTSNGNNNTSASTPNYIAGFAGDSYRNWFVFDLAAVTGTVTSASLLLWNPSIGYTGDATETYALFDVSTSIASLTGGTGGVAAYNDLGSGTVLGSYTASTADNGTVISILLNAAGIAAVNSALGGQFAIGGALTSFNGVYAQYLFGFSGAETSPGGVSSRLDLITTVPEPGTLALLGLGLMGLGLTRRKAA